jgi:hypothetical protein
MPSSQRLLNKVSARKILNLLSFISTSGPNPGYFNLASSSRLNFACRGRNLHFISSRDFASGSSHHLANDRNFIFVYGGQFSPFFSTTSSSPFHPEILRPLILPKMPSYIQIRGSPETPHRASSNGVPLQTDSPPLISSISSLDGPR